MSYIRKIEPEPPDDRSPMEIVMEELRDLHLIMRMISTRLAKLEALRDGNRSLTRPGTES